MERWLRGDLAQYAVQRLGDTTTRLIMFLAPQYHLLVEVTLGVESTLFRIKTDLWQLMAFVETFFSNVPE